MLIIFWSRGFRSSFSSHANLSFSFWKITLWSNRSQIFIFLVNCCRIYRHRFFLTIVCICIFKEVIHCRVYQSVKSQWQWKRFFVLLLLPWTVLLLIDLYSYLDLLSIESATFLVGFFFAQSLSSYLSFYENHIDSLFLIVSWYIF